MTPTMKHYTTAETAKAIRTALKAAFPATKFSVRSSNYAGGSSIRIGWTDGPTGKAVKAVAGGFEGKGFDGMIDMSYYIEAWVLGGKVVGTRSTGTEGSRGTVAAWGLEAPEPGAELVQFSSSYVFFEREISPAFANTLIGVIASYWGGVAALPVAVEGYRGFDLGARGNQPVRPDLGTNGCAAHYSWGSQIREAAEDRTKFLQT